MNVKLSTAAEDISNYVDEDDDDDSVTDYVAAFTVHYIPRIVWSEQSVVL